MAHFSRITCHQNQWKNVFFFLISLCIDVNACLFPACLSEVGYTHNINSPEADSEFSRSLLLMQVALISLDKGYPRRLSFLVWRGHLKRFESPIRSWQAKSWDLIAGIRPVASNICQWAPCWSIMLDSPAVGHGMNARSQVGHSRQPDALGYAGVHKVIAGSWHEMF